MHLQTLPLAAGALALLAQTLLLAFALHRASLITFRPKPARRDDPAPESWPAVTVQLPIYNERRVARRLIESVSRLDYPADRLEIQVLDDSTDETRAIVDRAAERAARSGVRIRLLRRPHRDGFKAGALQAGLACARGEYLAVFDADFVPPRDFLRRLMPRFRDPGVGMVQARWGHVNRGVSALTAAQAVLLDAHFVLEHEVRAQRGCFLNFNGSAGIWRRRCIEQAGGWSCATLTEDLDLSYRAQLAGWRMIYDGAVEVPAELPFDVAALKSQQRRWVKGSVQTARRILPELFRRPLPGRVRIEAVMHLGGNAGYPLLLLVGLLLPVRLFLPAPSGLPLLDLAVIALGVVPATAFLTIGQRALGRPAAGTIRDVASAMVLAAGLSLNNTIAVAQGFGREVGRFERTPKRGDAARGFGAGASGYRAAGGSGIGELVLSAYFALVAVVLARAGAWSSIPLAALLGIGLGRVGFLSWREVARGGPAARTGVTAAAAAPAV